MEMVKLPAKAKVYIGSRLYKGEVPANICPEKFKAKKPDVKTEKESGK